MKVLFIYYDTNSSTIPSVGFGVAYLSAFLKKHDHNTNLYYFLSSKDLAGVLSIIDQWQPNLIAHSSTSSSFSSVKPVVKSIKKAFPHLFQICGGNHVSLCPDELLNLPELDAICIGYGEYPLLELVEAFEKDVDYLKIQNLHIRTGKTIIKNSLREFPTNLDPFIPCDRQIFYDEFQKRSILSRYNNTPGENYHEFIFCRGCPYDCTFCSNHKLKTLGSGKYIQFPSVIKCIEELVIVKQKFNMMRVGFHDDNFTLNKKWFREFAKEYKSKVMLPYGCNLRVNCFGEEDVQILKDSGCTSATIGIESGSEYIRNKIMKKGINQKDIIKAFDLLHKYEIITCSQNMIGLPEETPERFLETIQLNGIIKPTMQAISIFYPYPGTVLYDQCIKDNLIVNNTENHSGFREREATVLNLNNFSEKDIFFYFKNFNTFVQYEHFTIKHKFLKKILPLTTESKKIILFLIKIYTTMKNLGKVCLAKSIILS